MTSPPSGGPAPRLPAAQRAMIAALGLAVLLASIDAPYPAVAPLHHIPTVLLMLAAPWLLRRWPLSNAAVACILAFFLLHTLGGRYTYSNVPYDAWSRALTGHDIGSTFGWTRNHYDRLVHFAFGLFAVRPVGEALIRHGGLGWRGAIAGAILFSLAVGALYEIFEWLLTLLAADATADDYNGQQGDPWDAQKDMALALLGSLAAAIVPSQLRPNKNVMVIPSGL